jgi:ubiquinone/menaquinone biosynthesis C-methylase UbiE
MGSGRKKTRPADIFMDIEAHIESGRFIRDCSLNRRDIRDFTFGDVDLSSCRDILDLGCAYGFFTRGLAGRLHPDAHINGVDLWGGCEAYFLAACRESGYTGQFCLSDKAFCKRYQDKSFDLVLCSYTLYFFPEAIGEISRILRRNGIFISVTHSVPHMQELTGILKNMLKEQADCDVRTLPMEKLMDAFSSDNGKQLLSPWFGEIRTKNYENTLRIDQESLSGLIRYLCFKKPLFFPDACRVDNRFIETAVADVLRDILARRKLLTITKNDTVYTCRHPQP